MGAIARGVGQTLCLGVAVVAPLAAGGVHRGVVVALAAVTALGLAAFLAGLATQGRALRWEWASLLPLALVVIPLLQSLPIPVAMRALIDPNGTTLLTDSDVLSIASWPLSLDPTSTHLHIAKAATALAVFMLAYHLASGQRRRHALLRAIGVAGIAVVVIGVSHRIFGITKIYGTFTSTHRTLLVGPFVNSNHTAEFLELATFVCVACAFLKPAMLNRMGWLVGALLCAGGAAATLSRGAVAALAMAVLLFTALAYLAREGSSSMRRRSSLIWGGVLLGLLALGGGVFGAGQLIDRFRDVAVTSDVRFQLWREGLNVLKAHPFGIGRGAFERVFPMYRTLQTSFPLRFSFLENQPLQLLVDSGYVLFALLLGAVVFVIWRILRGARRDKIEAALVAGLFAVAVHSIVDFGLETLGVLLPATAVLAIVFGRMRDEKSGSEASGRRGVILASVACAAGVLGTLLVALPSAQDFDARVKAAISPEDQRELLRRAQQVHPFDYYYPLRYARLVPLVAAPENRSPRLRVLNRALRLCPSCEVVHIEIARNLWRLDRREQALLEWRTAAELQPQVFTPALGELFAAGARPEELAAVASFDSRRMLEVARFLGNVSRVAEAMVALDQADALGAPRSESLLVRGTLQLQAGLHAEALATVAAARAAGVQNAGLAVLEARLLVAARGSEAAEKALAILDLAATRYQTDLDVQRARADLVLRYERWQASARAIEGLKLALFRAQGSASEAHTLSARVHVKLGRWTTALGEYRIALADDPSNVSLWLEFGRAAETAGRDTTARDAYAQAGRLMPGNNQISAALRSLDERIAKARRSGRETADPGPP